MINKKGDVWVSAVLYIALGMVIITIVLAAGIPLITQMKDRNTVAQTKRMMQSIDDNIRQVATEGPGSQRVISPLEIGSGQLSINVDNDYLEWKMTTKNKMMEPGINFQEGTLNLKLDETIIEDQYNIIIAMNYTGLADVVTPENAPKGPFKGKYNLVITHTGDFDTAGTPKISLGLL
ncbi:MAG: hypothetical protein ABIH63_02240 [archaeon]